jgi:cobalamin biosynthesis protein CobD/CbiB
MLIFAIIITVILEQTKSVFGLRNKFIQLMERYINFFTAIPIRNQRQLRLMYLYVCIPIILLLIALKILLVKSHFLNIFINLFLFILSVQILTWKEEAKHVNAASERSFVSTYANKFFAPLFWFIVLPSAIGPICYLLITQLSSFLKSKNIDLEIYNVVVDKMLFYINVIPYAILFIFIALASHFEESMHFILEKKKQFHKSFFFLENMLNELVLVANGKERFKIHENFKYDQEIEASSFSSQRYTPEITAYIVATLYRAGIFFIGLVVLISVAKIF